MPIAESTPVAESNYPTIEGLVETASPDELQAVFAPLKEALEAATGPRAEHAKKVAKAISRTEELLGYLLEVREKLLADRGGKGSKSR